MNNLFLVYIQYLGQYNFPNSNQFQIKYPYFLKNICIHYFKNLSSVLRFNLLCQFEYHLFQFNYYYYQDFDLDLASVTLCSSNLKHLSQFSIVAMISLVYLKFQFILKFCELDLLPLKISAKILIQHIFPNKEEAFTMQI